MWFWVKYIHIYIYVLWFLGVQPMIMAYGFFKGGRGVCQMLTANQIFRGVSQMITNDNHGGEGVRLI